jgi:hypothetical protein
MSGGSFDYAYSRVNTFVEELKDRLAKANEADDFGCFPNRFEPSTLAKLNEIAMLATKTALLMRHAEWLYSGDHSEEYFLKYVEDVEASSKDAMIISTEDAHIMFGLLGSIFYHGNFVAETCNEREVQALLEKYGYFFKTEEALLDKLYTNGVKTHGIP